MHIINAPSTFLVSTFTGTYMAIEKTLCQVSIRNDSSTLNQSLLTTLLL